jgi:hypothetical protein
MSGPPGEDRTDATDDGDEVVFTPRPPWTVSVDLDRALLWVGVAMVAVATWQTLALLIHGVFEAWAYAVHIGPVFPTGYYSLALLSGVLLLLWAESRAAIAVGKRWLDACCRVTVATARGPGGRGVRRRPLRQLRADERHAPTPPERRRRSGAPDLRWTRVARRRRTSCGGDPPRTSAPRPPACVRAWCGGGHRRADRGRPVSHGPRLDRSSRVRRCRCAHAGRWTLSSSGDRPVAGEPRFRDCGRPRRTADHGVPFPCPVAPSPSVRAGPVDTSVHAAHVTRWVDEAGHGASRPRLRPGLPMTIDLPARASGEPSEVGAPCPGPGRSR